MSTKATPEPVPLILAPKDVQELIRSKDSSSIRILDATWFMPNVQRDARKEFEQGPRIPNSSFWDVDKVATQKGEKDEKGNELNPLGLSHMMPTPKVFANAAGQHGITPDTHVIVYDTHGVFSSPRTAFTFHAFGHRAISILNGGLPAWIKNDFEVENGPPHQITPTNYPTPSLESTLIRSYDEMVANARMGARGQTVLDARPNGRFEGTAPEPRPGLSSGHIPNSTSLPATSLLDTNSISSDKSFTTLKNQTDLWRSISDTVGGMDELDKLRQASSAGESAVTNTCGSGMTAAILWLGLYQLGIQSSIYDESWTGYASRKESVIDKE
ncbi:Rhodanese-like protein [Meira miltonrushii]|uniref:Rhodanese-like protein n=1 Tax=Meira miltonrushii TaxID=1280837 RepID=A0A316VF13_9BASI|nr:Rhodanese-like protein [Meira miltonrushii]PWN36172.1 Rhodanese-like protein [Meira miltonrushii]